LLIATDGAIREFGRDGRKAASEHRARGRPRPPERAWEGAAVAHRRRGDPAALASRSLHHDDVPIATRSRRTSTCRATSKARFAGKLALNCVVLEPDTIALGDTAQLLER